MNGMNFLSTLRPAFPAYATAWADCADGRADLRLQVASSDYPVFVPHPGTSESPWFAIRTAVNRQRLLTGAATPSSLQLTILDAR